MVEYTIDKDAEGGSTISIDCHTFFTPAGYPITFDTEKLLEINSKDFVSVTESDITVPDGALFKFTYDGKRYRAIYKKSENKFYGYRQDDDHSIIYKEPFTKSLSIPHPINVFINNKVETKISKWDINNSQVYTGSVNEYKGEGQVITMLESRPCGALLFEYQNSPLMENDVFRRLILEDPCILEGASIHIADIILPGDDSYMKVFSAALAVAFAPVAIEYLIVPLLESLPTLGSEEAVRRSAQFITGASVDAILQAAINYYFVLEDGEQTWENAIEDIELLEVGASGIEAMFDTWLVEMVSSCMVDGFTENGELKTDFDGKDCVKGALSALLTRGVLSGGSKAIKKLKKLAVFNSGKFVKGLENIGISKSQLSEIARKLGIYYLDIKPSWLPDRTIISSTDNPVGIIGVWKRKTFKDGILVDIEDTYNVITKTGRQEMDDINYVQDGIMLLNIKSTTYKKETFWVDWNEPWLKNLTDKKKTVVVLSNHKDDYLKYEWEIVDGVTEFQTKNGQRIKTGYGKEIDFMENLVSQGKYKFDEIEGAYKSIME